MSGITRHTPGVCHPQLNKCRCLGPLRGAKSFGRGHRRKNEGERAEMGERESAHFPSSPGQARKPRHVRGFSALHTVHIAQQ